MKKIIKYLLVIAIVAFINPSISHAEVARVNNGLFQADYSITVNENMKGSGFVAGNSVIINNEVDGILFAAGNVLNVSNKSDYVFLAGSNVDLKESTFKDGFIAGSFINLEGIKAERDLYVAGQSIKIDGTIGRNLFIGGSDVVIDGVIENDLYVDATTLTINSNAKINGNLKYNDDADITISKDAIINSKTTYKNTSKTNSIDSSNFTKTVIINKFLDTLTNLFNMLVLGLLMVLLIPALFNKLKEIKANRLLPSLAWGVLILVSVPIIALIAIITYVGISTGLVLGAIYGILVYISTIISTYVITSLILKDKVKNPYLILLIGLPCVYIIKLIPFIGGLTSFALLCLGLGLLTNIYKRK